MFRMNTSELIRQLVRMCHPEDDAAFWFVYVYLLLGYLPFFCMSDVNFHYIVFIYNLEIKLCFVRVSFI